MLCTRNASLTLLALCVLAACQMNMGGRTVKRVDMLSAEDRQVAGELATAGLQQRAMIPPEDPRVYLVDVQELRDKHDESQSDPRRALVTHYRYQDDTAIQSVVDLAGKSVENVETLRHVAVPLADEEVKAALTLAKSDGRVAEIMNRPGVVTEHLLLSTASNDDPLYGYRIVRLMFRVDRDYVRAPIVLVNLTRRSVTLEEPAALPVGDPH
jgi:hypothetical protein